MWAFLSLVSVVPHGNAIPCERTDGERTNDERGDPLRGWVRSPAPPPSGSRLPTRGDRAFMCACPARAPRCVRTCGAIRHRGSLSQGEPGDGHVVRRIVTRLPASAEDL